MKYNIIHATVIAILSIGSLSAGAHAVLPDAVTTKFSPSNPNPAWYTPTEISGAKTTIKCVCKGSWKDGYEFTPMQIYASTTGWTWENWTFITYGNDSKEIQVPSDQPCNVVAFYDTDNAMLVVAKKWNPGDPTTIEFNVSEADIKIGFKPLRPDGTPLVPKVMEYNSSGQPVMSGEGLSFGYFEIDMQALKGVALNAKMGQNIVLKNGGSIINNLDNIAVYMNVNDCVRTFMVYTGITEDDGIYAVKIEPEDIQSGIYSNNPEDYIHFEARFAESGNKIPEYSDDMPGGRVDLNFHASVLNNWTLSDTYGSTDLGFHGAMADSNPFDYNHYHLCSAPVSDNQYAEVAVQPVRAMYYRKWGQYQKATQGMVAPRVEDTAEGPMWLVSKEVSALEEPFIAPLHYYSNIEGLQCLRSYNPWFSFPVRDDGPLFGDNVPITVVGVQPGGYVSYGYVGRYGESRSIDYLFENVSMYHNGNLVASSVYEVGTVTNPKLPNKLGVGVQKLETINSNVIVDGLQGTNTSVTEYDTTVEGCVVPVLQMLQVKDNEGYPVNEVENASDATLALAAGGFKFHPATYHPWYDYEPLQSIVVEYAPYGSEEFSPFEVTENPEKFFLPGYGAYYEGSLGQVTHESATGWYDLRISLTTSTGGSQKQTVSPAFRLATLGEVNTMTEPIRRMKVVNGAVKSSDGSEVTVYSLDGTRIANVSLRPGIYLAVSGEQTAKIVVR